MILKNRRYEKQAPSKEAKLFIILCEGKKREPDYFKYFQEISSSIKLEIILRTEIVDDFKIISKLNLSL
jgi:hypothetical protein